MFKNREKGFTLIELLVVVAILGILAVVAVPNIMPLMTAGDLGAAKGEAASVQTAVDAVIATASPSLTAAEIATLTQAHALVTPYLRGAVKGTYTVSADGAITGTGGWSGLEWDTTAHSWKKS